MRSISSGLRGSLGRPLLLLLLLLRRRRRRHGFDCERIIT